MAITTPIKGNKTADGDFTANKFITSGGASTDFVKGDGTLDSSTYLTTAIGGSITDNQLAVGAATANDIEGDTNFTLAANVLNGNNGTIQVSGSSGSAKLLINTLTLTEASSGDSKIITSAGAWTTTLNFNTPFVNSVITVPANITGTILLENGTGTSLTDVVHITGVETVTGAKTFSAIIEGVGIQNAAADLLLIGGDDINLIIDGTVSGSGGEFAIYENSLGSSKRLSLDQSGNLSIDGTSTIGTIAALGSTATTYLTHTTGLVQSRTAAQVLSDIGAQASGNYLLDTTDTFTGTLTVVGSILGNATFSAFNTLTTNLSLGGAATTLNIGGTPTSAITHNYSTNATANTFTKTINIGTGGVLGSTTNINIGSSAGGALGTTTINSIILSAKNITTTSTVTIGTIGALGSTATTFLTHTAGLVQSRTAAQVLSDIGGGTGTIGGSIIDDRVAVGATTANDIEGTSYLTMSTTLGLTVHGGTSTGQSNLKYGVLTLQKAISPTGISFKSGSFTQTINADGATSNTNLIIPVDVNGTFALTSDITGTNSGTNTGDNTLTTIGNDGTATLVSKVLNIPKFMNASGVRTAADASTILVNSVRPFDVSAATDEPSGSQDGIITTGMWDDTNYAAQQFHDFHNNTLWIRQRNATVWGAWDEVLTTKSTSIDDKYLRSDVADTKTSGELIFNNNVQLEFGDLGATSDISGNVSNTIWDLKLGDLLIRNAGSDRFTFGRTTGDLDITGNFNGTYLGMTGNIAIDSVTDTASEWSLLPVGYSRLINSANTGVPAGAAHGYFTKIGNRDTLGGWGGFYGEYSGNQIWYGSAVDNTVTATWVEILTSDAGSVDDKYLRSDVADYKTAGALTFDDNVQLAFGDLSAESYIISNGTSTKWRLKSGDLIISDNGTTKFTFGRTTGDLDITGVMEADGYNTVVADNPNIDTYLQTHFWETKVTTTDAGTQPENYAHIVNMGGDGTGRGTQLASSYTTNDSGFWIRRRSDNAGSENGANVWQDWKKITTIPVGYSGGTTPYYQEFNTSNSDPATWYKIFQGDASLEKITFYIESPGDNGDGHDKFEITLAGYSFEHHISHSGGGRYNTPILSDIRTTKPTSTTPEVWIKLIAVTTGNTIKIWSSHSMVAAASGTPDEVTSLDDLAHLNLSTSDRDNYTLMSDRGIHVQDRRTTTKGSKFIGGGAGAKIASFIRDVGASADTEVSISGNSGYPTIHFDQDLTTSVNALGFINNTFVISDSGSLALGSPYSFRVDTANDYVYIGNDGTRSTQLNMYSGTAGQPLLIVSGGTYATISHANNLNLKANYITFSDEASALVARFETSGDLSLEHSLLLNTNAEYLWGKVAGGTATRIHGISISDVEYIGSVDVATVSTRIGNNTGDIVFGNGDLTLGGTTGDLTFETGDSVVKSDLFHTGYNSTYTNFAGNTIGVRTGYISGTPNTGAVDFRRWTGTGTLHDNALICQVQATGGWGLGFKVDNQATNILASTTRMYIAPTGDVGIGTTNPSSKLHVAQTYSTATAGEFAGITLDMSYGLADTGLKAGFRLNTNATHTTGTQATIHGMLNLTRGSGNGGTTTNAHSNWSRIDTSTGHTITNAFTYSAQNPSVVGAITNWYGFYVNTVTGPSNRWAFYSTDSTVPSYFAGNVGIGITSPDALLEILVPNTGFNRALKLGNNTAIDGYGSYIQFSSSSSDSYGGIVGGIREASGGASALVFHTSTGINPTEKMRLDSAGSLGIGITNPLTKLHLKQAVDSSVGGLRVTDSSATRSISIYGTGSGGNQIIETIGTTNTFKIGTVAAGDIDFKTTDITRMTIDSGGAVDIVGVLTAIDGTRKTITDDATTTHTVGVADASVVRRFTSSSSITVTVDPGSLANIGETAEIDQYGTGLVTIVAGVGATLRVNAAVSLVSSGRYSRISIQRMTSTEYRVFGELA